VFDGTCVKREALGRLGPIGSDDIDKIYLCMHVKRLMGNVVIAERDTMKKIRI
jgi:hypothetical protein